MHRLIAGVALLFITYTACAAPQPFSARYVMSKGNITLGEVHRSLAPDEDGKFVFASTMQPGGLLAAFVKDQIAERSVWTYQNNQIKPLQYSYEKTGGKKERRISVTFDDKHGVAKITSAGETSNIAIEPRTYDQLLYQLAMMYDLQQGKRELTYPMVDTHKFKTYHFKVDGEENVDTPLGEIKTLKVQRIMAPDQKITTLWCAPSLSYLPVRIEERGKDGDEFTILIRSVEGLPN
ncbi:MAG: DUF3108 domain-containing protein [Pseudomonadota bacterium]